MEDEDAEEDHMSPEEKVRCDHLLAAADQCKKYTDLLKQNCNSVSLKEMSFWLYLDPAVLARCKEPLNRRAERLKKYRDDVRETVKKQIEAEAEEEQNGSNEKAEDEKKKGSLSCC